MAAKGGSLGRWGVARSASLAVAIVVACSVIGVAISAAATGDLAFNECVENSSGPDTCAKSQIGLFNAYESTVSSDGKSVYAITHDGGSHALTAFTRDTSTGALTPVGCFSDNDAGVGSCTRVDGLSTPTGLDLSADGKSLYVTAETDDTLTRFSRNTTTGALTWQSCIDDTDSTNESCAQSTQRLDGAQDVVVSPNGSFVFVAADNISDDFHGSIVRFSRSSTDGSLTALGATQMTTPVTMVDVLGAGNMAISPGGQSLYVVGGSGSFQYFDVDSAGALTYRGCAGTTPSDPNGCLFSNGLAGVASLAVSPDGNSLYAAAPFADAIVSFDRAGTGALSNVRCVEDPAGTDAGCAATAGGMSGVSDVAVSPDDKSVYAAAESADGLVSFDRAANGNLTSAGCISDDDTGAAACATKASALNGANSVAISPDPGKSVYVTSRDDSAIVNFDREATTTPPADTDPPQTKVTSGPKKKSSDRTPTFKFSSDEPGSTFKCKLNQGFEKCKSPKTQSKLPYGSYAFQVKATDAAGNVDPSPAKLSFKIAKKKR